MSVANAAFPSTMANFHVFGFIVTAVNGGNINHDCDSWCLFTRLVMYGIASSRYGGDLEGINGRTEGAGERRPSGQDRYREHWHGPPFKTAATSEPARG